MNSIKSLITETEKGCRIFLYEIDFEYIDDLFERKVDCGDAEVITGETQYWQVCKTKLETLKLCQEIQDAKVKELKEELTKPIASPAMEPFVSQANYYAEARLKVLKRIDKIFGDKSQAVKDE
jgi:hypothetical protein